MNRNIIHNLCLIEKFHILKAEKRPELITKCCHENTFYAANYKLCSDDRPP